jgi:hypothetical protein
MRSFIVVAIAILSIPFNASAEVDCSKINSRYQFAQCNEKEMIKKYPNIIERDGDRLIVHLTNGRTKEFADSNKDNDQALAYSFVDYYEIPGYIHLELQFWEGGSNYLVNIANGEIEEIMGIPVFSPEYSRVAAYQCCDVLGFYPSVFKIYKVSKSGLVGEMSEAPSIEPSDLKWVSETKLEFNKNIIDVKKGDYLKEKTPGELIYQNGQWVLK